MFYKHRLVYIVLNVRDEIEFEYPSIDFSLVEIDSGLP